MSDRFLAGILVVIVGVWAVESLGSFFYPVHPDGAVVAGIGGLLGAFAAYIGRRASQPRNGKGP